MKNIPLTRAHFQRVRQSPIFLICLLLLFTLPSNAQSTLKITNGSTVKVQNGATLVIKDGKMVNNGTFEAGDGTVKITGISTDSESTIGGSNHTTFHNLTIDKNSNNALLEQDIAIKGTLNLQKGHLDLQNQQLTIQNTGAISNASANSYVKTPRAGALQREVGDRTVHFPVGNASYNPVTLDNTRGTVDNYQVRVTDSRLEDGNLGTVIQDSSVRRTWMISEEIIGGSNLEMTLQWNRNEESPTFNRNEAYITHYDSGDWDTHPPIAAAGNNPYTLTRNEIQSLSPFSIASASIPPAVPTMGEWGLLNLALLLMTCGTVYLLQPFILQTSEQDD